VGCKHQHSHDAFVVVCFRRHPERSAQRGVEGQPQPTEPFSPNNHPVPEFPQKYLKKVANFQRPNNDTNPTTIHHQPTTTSPQKHHAKTSPLPKPPSKNARTTTKITPSDLQKNIL
jgi:hypothetical protein